MDVQCSACGFANAAGARFCVECGATLAAACPSCSMPVATGQRFCGNCGSPLAAATSVVPPAPSSPLAERRVCSILFCDLVGFTPLSESKDPETVRELLSRYFDTARTVIGRYGGVLEKFIGDAVMAVWGTPVATEDDAERAVRAALELVDAVDALGRATGEGALAARVGVVTAEVAVTIAAEGQGMVAGDPVNTAARIQATAEPRQVLTDDATARQVRAAIELDNADSHVLKGKAKPQHLWRAVRVLSNVAGVQRIDGLEAPLIGRDVELRILKDLFHATADRRMSQLVTVVGDAGSGKSRLGWEFEKYVDGLADTVFWHRGRCRSYGDGVTFWALTEIVRQRLGIADEDPVDVALALLLQGLDQYIPDQVERTFVGVRLGRLLSTPHPDDDGRDLDRSDLFAGWRTWLARLADTAPVIWVIEDLQFADSGLLEFLGHLLDWTRTSPIHVLTLARPEIDAANPGWTTGRRRHQITLEPLDDASMHRLLEALVPALPKAPARLIADQAQGNPLFAVETIRALIDRDLVVPIEGRYRLVGEIAALEVPDSLRGLFSARLDHLDPASRDLVATAAVLGTTFPAEALATVADRPVEDVRATLDRLVDRELLTVSADPLSPQRGNYAFTHDLLRRVAVDTLSRHDRRARHLRVAEHLRTAFPDDGEEVADVIARHLLDAVQSVPEAHDADEHRLRAISELIRAARRSAHLGAPRRAAVSYQEAAELTADRRRSAELFEDAAQATSEADDYDEAVRLAEHASGIYREVGLLHEAARAESLAGSNLAMSGQLAAARPRLEAAVAELRGSPDRATVDAIRRLAQVAVSSGAADARSLTEEAVRLGEQLSVDGRELSLLFHSLGLMHAYAGEWARATAAFRESARLATSAGDWNVAAVAYVNLASNQYDISLEEACESAALAIEFARRAGSRSGIAFGVENLSDALLSLGRWDEAQAAIDEVDRVDDVGDFQVFNTACARIAGLRGDWEGLDLRTSAIRASPTEDPQIRYYLAYFDLLASQHADAAERVMEAGLIAVGFHSTVGIGLVAESWVIAARAAAQLDRDVSANLLDVLASYMDTELSPSLRAERQLADARLAPDPEPAFGPAIAAQRAASPPHLLAQGLLDWAEFRIANDRAHDALPLIDEGAEIAARLGAAPIAERAEALRRRYAEQPIS